MGLPYERATAGAKALGETEKLLRKFGCENFGVMNDWKRGLVIVAFTHHGRQVNIEASWRGYAEMWKRANPYNGRSDKARAAWLETAEKRAELAVPSMLRDWIKGQVTAVECGMMPFEQAFITHMLLPDGRPALQELSKILALPGAKS